MKGVGGCQEPFKPFSTFYRRKIKISNLRGDNSKVPKLFSGKKIINYSNYIEFYPFLKML